MSNLFISIIGLLGSGKSVMSKEFEANGFKLFSEPVETNPFLEPFYKDMKRWGLTMQLFLLHYRFRQHIEQIHYSGDSVSDSSIFADYCFANMLKDDGLITQDEYNLYENALSNMKKHLVYPDAIVFINANPEKALERVKIRARGCEVGVTVEYLSKLHNQFVQMVNRISQYTPVIILEPYDDMEALKRDVPELIAMLRKTKEQGSSLWSKKVEDFRL